MSTLLLGNIFSFFGSLLITVSGYFKTRKNFLLSQAVISALLCIGNLLLGGYTGAIVGVVSFIRNLSSVKWKLNTQLKLIFIALQIGLSLAFGADSLIMWVPVICDAAFTWFVDTDNMIFLKSVSMATQLGWIFYDLYIKAYASIPFEIGFIITSIIAIVKIASDKKNKTEKDPPAA